MKVENRLTEILGCATTIDLEQGTLVIKYGKNNEVLQGVLEHLGYEEF
jgi:heat shock protein HslJ